MATVKIEYKGKNYELGFTRNTVVSLERNGFEVSKISAMPMTMVPMFWQGAFAAYNKGVKRALMDEIYEHLEDKQGLLSALIELYAETLSTLTDEPEESQGNVKWEIVR